MATIKEIAQLAGVSRGTVDRVLNKRGLVKPEKEQKVLEIAQALNYMPNRAGKTLAIRKKQLKFGYLLMGSTSGNPFFSEVVRGIERRAAELTAYGVSVVIRSADLHDPKGQVKLIDELLKANIAGLAITPVNHAMVAGRIKALAERGFPVVTANSDIPDCGRIAYVGSDYTKSGETAAGLVNLVCGGRANIGIITGSDMVLCHSERVAGFTRSIKNSYPGIKITSKLANHDDDIESFLATRRLLERHPETDALYLAAAGVTGACRAVAESGRRGKIKVIGNDVTAASKPLIKSGEISAVITQEPLVQGAKPLDILLDSVGMDIKPDREYYYTALGIVIKENL